MEDKVKIPTSDGHIIFGKLTNGNSDKLVILVHGLTSDMDDHIFYNGARYFSNHGFAVFRFNLYGWEKEARKFKDSTFADHALDLETVMTHFEGRYSSLYVVGHSLGCPTILLSSLPTKLKAVVFWDPSYQFSKFMPQISSFHSEFGVHLLDGAFEVVVRDVMYKSLTTNFPDCFEVVSRMKKPICIIAAGDGLLLEGAALYEQHSCEPRKLVVIAGATHCFDEEGAEVGLFGETLKWIIQY